MENGSVILFKPKKAMYFWLRFIINFSLSTMTVLLLNAYMFICEISWEDFQAILNYFNESPLDLITGYAGNMYFCVLLLLIMCKLRHFANGVTKIQEFLKNYILQDSQMMEKCTRKVFLFIAWYVLKIRHI